MQHQEQKVREAITAGIDQLIAEKRGPAALREILEDVSLAIISAYWPSLENDNPQQLSDDECDSISRKGSKMADPWGLNPRYVQFKTLGLLREILKKRLSSPRIFRSFGGGSGFRDAASR